MPINTKLALYNPFSVKREYEECLPKKLEAGKFYKFKEEGIKIYPLGKKIPLVQIIDSEYGKCLKPLAEISIVEETHYLLAGLTHTKGEYIVHKLYIK